MKLSEIAMQFINIFELNKTLTFNGYFCTEHYDLLALTEVA